MSQAAAERNSERSPNVVIVLTDDQGWGDLSLNGNTNLSTPRLDQLAEDGAVLEQFYVQPVCAPTRAELLTGRYYPRTGVHGLTRGEEYLNLDEVTLGDVFQAAGYATGCFGKWHNGSQYPYHPNGRGFDEFFGFCCGHWSHYFDTTLEHNGEEVENEGYIADSFTDQALNFIEENRDRPFLCYVPYNIPHLPFQVPDRWFDKFADKELEMRYREPGEEDLDKTRAVLAMCENIDWNVGRLVDKIEELGLVQETIFVFFSDNGPHTERWNGGMRGMKGWTEEGGVRSPCSITWAGTIEGSTAIDEVAGAIDLLPTLAELAGVNLITPQPLDGVSLTPLLCGNEGDQSDRAIFAHGHTGEHTSIRTRRYRAGGESDGLFDMVEDPGQNRDLSASRPELYHKLKQRIREWREDVVPDEHPERLLPVGYPEFPVTYLNAHDATATGEIGRSSIYVYTSYFVNWRNTGDVIYWEIDVKTPGEYEVTLMYTCSEGDEGSEIEVAFGSESLSGRIDEPFDPPLKDDRDRVERVVSYEKEFLPFSLGRMRLPREAGRLYLRAKRKTGDEICQVRMLKVELVGPLQLHGVKPPGAKVDDGSH